MSQYRKFQELWSNQTWDGLGLAEPQSEGKEASKCYHNATWGPVDRKVLVHTVEKISFHSDLDVLNGDRVEWG